MSGCVRVADPVHGVLRLSPEALRLAQTLVFARCANVSQLSCADRVAPAARVMRVVDKYPSVAWAGAAPVRPGGGGACGGGGVGWMRWRIPLNVK